MGAPIPKRIKFRRALDEAKHEYDTINHLLDSAITENRILIAENEALKEKIAKLENQEKE